ncbi:Major facilitator superfamily domain-containing protein [Rhodotorula toruloides]|uniref:Major facilitator superfamily domain-containing protein n=1 Tax=Rhodotorula toruloides TaxID=5286 RepID=A0A2T0AHY7_RHOTO|nr:Major facilitator superfamily domain-containing protein [Rhodotorula toruloides]
MSHCSSSRASYEWFGAIAPILVLYLTALGFSDSNVGLFLSLTLFGDVVLALSISWIADSVGRRRVLAVGSAMMAASGFVFFLSGRFIVLLLAATFGVISPSGNEVGPFSSVEVGMLSQLVQPEDRIYVLMHYQILGFVGLALGSLVSGAVISHLEKGASSHEAYRFVFLAYGCIGLVKVALSLFMTPYTELDHPHFPERLVDSPEASEDEETDVDDEPTCDERQSLIAKRPLIDRTASSTPQAVITTTKLTLGDLDDAEESALPLLSLVFIVLLFSVDSFASSLTPASYVSLYLKSEYGATIRTITTVLASSALGAVVTSLLTGAISKRIGLVLTMVTTHIPAQILTGAMAFAPTLPIVIGLYIARTCISSMDSSIRGALLSAMVPKHARTRLLGISDVARTLAAAPGPFVTGRLVEIDRLRWVFVISGAIKIGYDLALLGGFRQTKLQH